MKNREVTNTSLTPTISRIENGKRANYVEMLDAELSLVDVVKKALRHKLLVVVIAMATMSAMFVAYALIGTWYQSEILVNYNSFENSSLFQYIDKIIPAGDDDRSDNREAYVSRAVLSLNSRDFYAFLIEQSKENEVVRQSLKLDKNAAATIQNINVVKKYIETSFKFDSGSTSRILKDKKPGSFYIQIKNFSAEEVQKMADLYVPLIMDFMAKKEIADIQSIRQLVTEKLNMTRDELSSIKNKKIDIINSSPINVYESYSDMFNALQSVKAMIAGNRTLQVRFEGVIAEIEKNLFKIDQEKMQQKELGIMRSEVSGLLYQKQYGEIQGMDPQSVKMKGLEEQLLGATTRLKELLASQKKIADKPMMTAEGDTYFEEYSLGEKLDSVEELKTQNAYFVAKVAALEQVLKAIGQDIKSHLVASMQLDDLTKLAGVKESLVASLEKGLLQLDLADFKTLKRQEVFYNPPVERSIMRFSSFCILVLVVGTILGLIAGFTAERKNPTLATRKSFDELGLPVLGQVPSVEGSLLSSANLHSSEGRFSSLCYTRLGINLLNNLAYINSQIVTFTSDNNARISSMIALNMATYFARTGKRVLVIEADMKNNLLSKLTGAAEVGGLQEVCGVGKEINIKPVEIEPHLHLLNGDSRGLSDMYRLASSSFLDLLTELKKEYELIFIHAEPCLVGPDAADLSRYSGVALVCCNVPQMKISTLEKIIGELRLFLSKNIYFILESPDDIYQSGYLNTGSFFQLNKKKNKKEVAQNQKAA